MYMSCDQISIDFVSLMKHNLVGGSCCILLRAVYYTMASNWNDLTLDLKYKEIETEVRGKEIGV